MSKGVATSQAVWVAWIARARNLQVCIRKATTWTTSVGNPTIIMEESRLQMCVQLSMTWTTSIGNPITTSEKGWLRPHVTIAVKETIWRISRCAFQAVLWRVCLGELFCGGLRSELIGGPVEDCYVLLTKLSTRLVYYFPSHVLLAVFIRTMSVSGGSASTARRKRRKASTKLPSTFALKQRVTGGTLPFSRKYRVQERAGVSRGCKQTRWWRKTTD